MDLYFMNIRMMSLPSTLRRACQIMMLNIIQQSPIAIRIAMKYDLIEKIIKWIIKKLVHLLYDGSLSEIVVQYRDLHVLGLAMLLSK